MQLKSAAVNGLGSRPRSGCSKGHRYSPSCRLEGIGGGGFGGVSIAGDRSDKRAFPQWFCVR